MREKLIALMDEYLYPSSVEGMADHLIANGATIPVRCADCKNRTNGLCPMENYNVPWDVMSDDAFCSFGERKDDA